MNKNECVKYCEKAIKEMWEKHGGPKDFNERRTVYKRCKEICKESGYTESTFVMIWNKASDNIHKVHGQL